MKKIITLLLVFLFASGCQTKTVEYSEPINIVGEWKATEVDMSEAVLKRAFGIENKVILGILRNTVYYAYKDKVDLFEDVMLDELNEYNFRFYDNGNFYFESDEPGLYEIKNGKLVLTSYIEGDAVVNEYEIEYHGNYFIFWLNDTKIKYEKI